MALCCIISEISDKSVENRDFLYPLAFDAPVRVGRRRSIVILICADKLEWCGYPVVS